MKQTESLKNVVYNSILNGIIQDEYKPGQIINEKELTEKLARLNELDALLNIDGSASSIGEGHIKENTGDNRTGNGNIVKNSRAEDDRRTDGNGSKHTTMKERLAIAKEKAGRNGDIENKKASKSRASEEAL